MHKTRKSSICRSFAVVPWVPKTRACQAREAAILRVLWVVSTPRGRQVRNHAPLPEAYCGLLSFAANRRLSSEKLRFRACQLPAISLYSIAGENRCSSPSTANRWIGPALDHGRIETG